jgi:regulator of sigma E protease
MGLIYFLLLLGGLVFFHEFGHFIVARMCGVKVLTFSLGFGPGWSVYTSPKSGTEYRLSILPLGGYVKMLGEDPTEVVEGADEPGAFSSKALWKRTLIVAAGPFFNLILPVFIFFFLGIFTAELPPSEIGMVMNNGPAWEAGLREGDRVVSINGEEVKYWWQLHEKISDAAEQDLDVTVRRGDEILETKIRPRLYSELRIPELGFMDQRGQIRVGAEYVKPVLSPRPGGMAEKAGVQGWDWVTSVNGEPVERFSELRNALEQQKGPLELTVVRKANWFNPEAKERPDLENAVKDKITLNSPGVGEALEIVGLGSAENAVFSVEEESPAAALIPCPQGCDTDVDCSVGSICNSGQCVVSCTESKQCASGVQCVGGYCDDKGLHGEGFSLAEGDWVLAHNGTELQRWHHLRRKLYEFPERVHRLDVLRESGAVSSGCFIPKTITVKNEFNSDEKKVFLGAANLSALDMPSRVANEDRFAYASHRAIWDTLDAIRVNVFAIAGLFVGNVPMNQLGGPIFIGQLAAKTQERGARWFFGIMVMLSINLGLLNLLPVPMLDGGHLFFFAIEGITRKPVSIRIRQIAAYIGLSFIFLLMIMVFKNDLERLLGGM